MTRLLRCFVLIAAITAAAAPEAVAQPRSTMAFVVGIEHYRDTTLDALKYSADDARMVYQQLRAITNLDTARSQLLVADDDGPSFVDSAALLSELQSFANNITDNTDVIVYLGGHGSAGAGNALWFLASNYSNQPRNGYLSFGTVISTFKESIDDVPRHNVTLTIMLNMCEAGNAVRYMGAGTNPQLVERARQSINNREFGMQRLALIPATLPDRTTYESDGLKSSVFAGHLREALGGRAGVDGVITTGSLFAYLEKNLGDLPEARGFDKTIAIGATRALEGETDYVLGSALLSAARSMDTSQRDRDRLRHRLALQDLADYHLSRVRLQSASLGLRALTLQTRARLSRGLPPPISKAEVSGISQIDSQEDLQQLEGLLDQAAESAGPPSLKALHDELAAGAPFYGLILGSRAPLNSTPSERFDFLARDALGSATDSATSAWRSAFTAMKGRQAIEVVNSEAPDRLASAEIDSVIARWAAGPLQSQTRLVVVHVGGTTRAVSGSDVVGGIVAAAGRWNGPVTLVLLGAYSTPMIETLLRPSHSFSVFLASGDGAVGLSMPRALMLGLLFRDGAADLAAYSNGGTDGVSEDTRAGGPVWIPNWPQGWLGSRDIQPPLDQFSLQVAAGCTKERPEDCTASVMKRILSDPFRAVLNAGAADLEGRGEAASAAYREVAAQFRAAADWMLDTLVGVTSVFRSSADLLELRAQGVEMRATRQLVILPVGIEEYESPLVGDLPGTLDDLAKYAKTFTSTGAGSKQLQQVQLRSVLVPKTADDFLSALRAERATLNPQDLLILVYSGRGVERDGRRYLTTAQAAPCPPGVEAIMTKCDERANLVDVWQLADIMRDRWFVGIYDTQFTKPVFDPDRSDAILDKHLDSARPAEPAADDSGPSRSIGRRSRTVARGAVPHQQVHVWVEGPLTVNQRTTDCGARSPLAAAITNKATEHPGTYADWLGAVASHPCLSSETVLVAQGDLDVPFLVTGNGAHWVNVFRRDDLRRSMNLRVAAALGGAAAAKFDSPHNRIAQAALLLALRWQHPKADLVSQGEMDWWVVEAQEILTKLKVPSADVEMTALEALRTQLLIDTYLLTDRRAEAVALLEKTEPAVLARRRLAERMVSLTEDEARRQPIGVMNATSKKLQAAQQLLKDHPGIAAAQRRLETLIRGEESKLVTDFVLQPARGQR